jgi:hypothetical protein
MAQAGVTAAAVTAEAAINAVRPWKTKGILIQCSKGF